MNRYVQVIGDLPMHHRLYAGGFKTLETCMPHVRLEASWSQYGALLLSEWNLTTTRPLTLEELAVVDPQSIASTDFVRARWSQKHKKVNISYLTWPTNY